MRILIRASIRSLVPLFTSTQEVFLLTMTMLLTELQHAFDVIGLSETKIKNSCQRIRLLRLLQTAMFSYR